MGPACRCRLCPRLRRSGNLVDPICAKARIRRPDVTPAAINPGPPARVAGRSLAWLQGASPGAETHLCGPVTDVALTYSAATCPLPISDLVQRPTERPPVKADLRGAAASRLEPTHLRHSRVDRPTAGFGRERPVCFQARKSRSKHESGANSIGQDRPKTRNHVLASSPRLPPELQHVPARRIRSNT